MPYWRHHTGHAIGMRYHEGPFSTRAITRRSYPGMVFTVEPGLYPPELGGFRHSDTAVVTGDGVELVTYHPATSRASRCRNDVSQSAGAVTGVDVSRTRVLAAGVAGLMTLAATGSAARIVGTSGNDTLRGTGVADRLYGRKGNDTLYGDGGNDLLVPGSDGTPCTAARAGTPSGPITRIESPRTARS